MLANTVFTTLFLALTVAAVPMPAPSSSNPLSALTDPLAELNTALGSVVGSAVCENSWKARTFQLTGF